MIDEFQNFMDSLPEVSWRPYIDYHDGEELEASLFLE